MDADLAGLVGGTAALQKRGAGLLQHDVAALALQDGIDGVAQSLEGLTREAAGARLVTRKAAFIEQQDAPARPGKVVSGGATGRAGTDDQGVVGGGHWLIVVSSE